jgi:hypothetical protein
MIEKIDLKISRLLKCRDSEEILQNPKLRGLICDVISRAYFLEYTILSHTTFTEHSDDKFFTANAAVNRIFRDYGLDEVADIYNELKEIAAPYMIK